MKCQFELLAKEDEIGKLQNQVLHLKNIKLSKPIAKNSTSVFLTKFARASNLNSKHLNITKLRDYVLQKLEGIPRIQPQLIS